MKTNSNHADNNKAVEQMLLDCLYDDIESLETLQMYWVNEPVSAVGGLSREQMWGSLRHLVALGRVNVLKWDGQKYIPIDRECIKESEREEYWFALAQRQ